MLPKEFSVRVVGSGIWDPVNDNVDVEVTLADGRKFGATFFTIKNVERLFQKNRDTGECAGGVYLWAASMILVQELTIRVIEKSVEDLLETEEFHAVFSPVS